MTADHALLAGSYDLPVVVLSVLIAVLASYAALDLARSITVSRVRVRNRWIVASAVVQGFGIWAMHYTGMLAFTLPVPIRYTWPFALLALGIATSGTSGAMFVVSRRQVDITRALLGSVWMTAAIVGLHYVAMASMRTAAMHRYDLRIVALSALFALIFSVLSLWLAFQLRRQLGEQRLSVVGGALQMGGAITLMHYTGMAAITFTRSDVPPDWSHAVSISSLGNVAFAGATVVVLGGFVMTSMLEQRGRRTLELERSFNQLRALTARLQKAREEERTRVAREIHDELGQLLTSLKMDLYSLVAKLPEDPDLRQRAQSVLKLVDDILHSVRTIAADLRPAILDDLGLVAAVEWAAQEFQTRTGIASHVRLPSAGLVLDSERATAVFRILQETLTNIARHAKATEAHIRLAEEDGLIVLEVRDNGVGFDANVEGARSLGLLGMRERTVLLGGALQIESTPGAGTTVRVAIPRTTSDAGEDG